LFGLSKKPKSENIFVKETNRFLGDKMNGDLKKQIDKLRKYCKYCKVEIPRDSMFPVCDEHSWQYIKDTFAKGKFKGG